MGIALTVLIIEVAIVAAGGYGAVGDTQHRLEVAILGVLHRFVDTDMPGLAFVVMAAQHYLATYLHHEVLDAMRPQQTGHHITAIAFGNGAEVHLITYLQQAVNLLGRRQLVMFEAKAPGIDQRSHMDIEGAIGLLVHGLRQLENLAEHGGTLHCRVAAVDAGNSGLGVKHRKLTINLLQLGLDLSLQVVGILIGDIINGAKHQVAVLLERRLFRAGYQKQQTKTDKQEPPHHILNINADIESGTQIRRVLYAIARHIPRLANDAVVVG